MIVDLSHVFHDGMPGVRFKSVPAKRSSSQRTFGRT